MLLQKYKPTLKDFAKVDSLPENLGFLQDSLGNIFFNNACNYVFGALIRFQKGNYKILVCDTTRIPCKRIEGWCSIPIDNQYKMTQLGYDLTPKIEKSIRNRKKTQYIISLCSNVFKFFRKK